MQEPDMSQQVSFSSCDLDDSSDIDDGEGVDDTSMVCGVQVNVTFQEEDTCL